MKFSKLVVAALISSVFFVSCTDDNDDNQDDNNEQLESKILVEQDNSNKYMVDYATI